MSSLEERIKRLEDISQIQNIMGKYVFLHTAGRHEQTAELFANKTPGVRMEISPIGVWEGKEGVRKIMVGIHRDIFKVGEPGYLYIHNLATPVIEVAGDGKTAKAVWTSPGIESIKDPKVDKFFGYWLWGSYGVDFIKEDGQWKFWHLHVYLFFMTSYDKSWTEPQASALPPIPDELKPDRPSAYKYVYSPTAEIKLAPVPPEPYKTFDEKAAY